MKGKLTKLQWTAVIGFVVIALLGGGGYYYVSTMIDGAQQELNSNIGRRDKLVGAPVYPSNKSFKTLNENNQLLKSAIDDLSARLSTPDNKLAAVPQKNPIEFKQDLAVEQKKLAELARANHVQIPNNFPFGFGRYNSLTPLDRDTIFLGKQMVAIDEIITQLFQSKITRLLSVRRSYDEVNGGRINESLSDPSGEYLRAKVIEVGKGVYTATPFEIQFLGKPAALRTFMNKLTNSPYIFIVRSIQIISTKLDPVTLDALSRESTASDPTADQSASTDPSAVVVRPPLHAMGFEDIQVTMRIDLIEWFGHVKELAHAKGAAKNT